MSKLLEQGSFGCIFYPGIDCQGKFHINKKVTKIQKNNVFSKKEIMIGNKVKEIDRYTDFFVPISDSCEIEIGEITDEDIKKELKKCEIISKNKTFPFISMSMPYIEGGDLLDILNGDSDNKEVKFSKLFASYYRLIMALKLLEQESIVHFDLKGNNILFDSVEQSPKLIDFGISFQSSELTQDKWTEAFYAFGTEYYIWPPEVHIICFLIHEERSILTLDECKMIITECIKENTVFSFFTENERTELERKFLKRFEKHIGKNRNEVIKDLIKASHTWDNYALSLLYLNIIRRLFPETEDGNEFIQKMSDLLKKNVSTDYLERLTLNETMNEFEKIIQSDIKTSKYYDLMEQLKIEEASKILKQETKYLTSIRNTNIN